LLDYRRLLHCHWLPRLLDDHRLPGRLHHHNLTRRLLDHRRLDSARLLHDRRLPWLLGDRGLLHYKLLPRLLDHKRLPWLLVNDPLVRLRTDKLLPRLPPEMAKRFESTLNLISTSVDLPPSTFHLVCIS
jgi:hypothetical protein